MQRFTHDDAEVAFERRGRGPAMLFLHNGGTSSGIWRHQIDALSNDFDTVAVDLPGFGRSPRPAGGLDLPAHVALVEALIDHLELSPLLLVGNCMGANIAAAVACRAGAAGLVLINPLTEATFSAGGLGFLHGVHRVAPIPSRIIRRASRAVVPPRLVAAAAVRFQLGRRGVARGLHHDPMLLAGNQRRDQLPALVDVLDDLAAYGGLDRDPRPPLPPTCTVWGAANRVLSPRAGERLNDRLRPERAEVLSGCGHLPMLEDPDAVTEIIRSFASTHLVHLTRHLPVPTTTGAQR